MFYFSDFITMFFDLFYFFVNTSFFLNFMYVFLATGIIVIAQKLIKMVLSL